MRPGDVLTLECNVETVRGPIGRGKVRATVDGELAVRGTLTFAVGAERMIGRANGPPISITGLGCHVPERIVTNDELATLVDTNDEWIRRAHRDPRAAHRRRRRGARPTSRSPPAARALEMAGVDPASIDLLIVATVTPDMAFPSTAAMLADQLGMPDAAAYDLSAGCTGFVYAIAQALRRCSPSGLAKRALVVGGDVLSKILDWTDRSTLVLFGDGAGAVVMERGRARAASSASSSARTAAAARTSGCRAAARGSSRIPRSS